MKLRTKTQVTLTTNKTTCRTTRSSTITNAWGSCDSSTAALRIWDILAMVKAFTSNSSILCPIGSSAYDKALHTAIFDVLRFQAILNMKFHDCVVLI
jgi:hypothetical protein